MTKPHVLLIDDAPQSATLPDSIQAIPLDPEDANFGPDLEAALVYADLILLDQNLHREQVLGLGALDGASFVGNLRSWARAKELTLPPVVIYTSEYEAFADEIPTLGPAVPLEGSFIGKEARIASALDVEWLIPKDENYSVGHIASLARDCLLLRADAADARMNLQEISDFLAVPRDQAWSEIAVGQIAKWRPPINEAGNAPAGSRGVTPVLRWLLHQVLPCPGLLLSDLYAAWSLGIEPKSFSALYQSANTRDWVQALRATCYGGAAKDLVNRRWWAAGIDFIGWRLRERGYELGSFQHALDELAGPGLMPLAAAESVVVVNVDLEEAGIAALEDAVQIYPPGWPTEAVDPWMRRDEVKADPVAQTMIDLTELPVVE
ncbi:hypothetical protein [Mesorhizobium sp. B1-1-8]|uniref:hypothetical protein n=1 Tax=Mesorhizobium sp. B1-1-8 TaxID=2589976 RepID=UPI00112CE028|nr:hypothetical protein [Mesorhizobium sp. B1-1-8]UCI07215.1 hypothetical protein FJ974_26070 [Mesorhizobium sp. B1-1-8]